MRAGKRQPVSGAAAVAQGRKNFFKNFFFLCIKNESWRIITAERKQIRFSSDRARFPLKVVYRLFTTLPHTHKLLLALRRLRDTHAWAHSFLNAAFRSALFRADCAPREKCPALARRAPGREKPTACAAAQMRPRREKGSPNRASLVRCNDCNSHSAGDLAAAEAAGACVDVLGFAVHDGLDALHIGFPSAVRAAVRVAHFDAEAQALVAKLTFCHWLKHLLLYCLREQLFHNSRNPGRLQDDFHIFCAFSVRRPEKMPGTLQKPLPNAAALGTMGSGGAGAPPGRNNFAAAPAALPERRRARWAHHIIPSRCKRSLPSRG